MWPRTRLNSQIGQHSAHRAEPGSTHRTKSLRSLTRSNHFPTSPNSASSVRMPCASPRTDRCHLAARSRNVTFRACAGGAPHCQRRHRARAYSASAKPASHATAFLALDSVSGVSGNRTRTPLSRRPAPSTRTAAHLRQHRAHLGVLAQRRLRCDRARGVRAEPHRHLPQWHGVSRAAHRFLGRV